MGTLASPRPPTQENEHGSNQKILRNRPMAHPTGIRQHTSNMRWNGTREGTFCMTPGGEPSMALEPTYGTMTPSMAIKQAPMAV